MSLESKITVARLTEKELRYRFEAAKEEEWRRISADARAAVERAVWDARQNGISINKIAQAYGTKNRGTIYEILHRRESTSKLMPEVGLGSLIVSQDSIGAADGYPNPYHVEAQNYALGDDSLNGWVRIYFRELGQNPKVIEASEVGSSLHGAFLAWSDERFTTEIIRQIG